MWVFESRMIPKDFSCRKLRVRTTSAGRNSREFANVLHSVVSNTFPGDWRAAVDLLAERFAKTLLLTH